MSRPSESRALSKSQGLAIEISLLEDINTIAATYNIRIMKDQGNGI